MIMVVVEIVVFIVDKGDVIWMMVLVILVMVMLIFGFVLFYGGLVCVKNMLLVLM